MTPDPSAAGEIRGSFPMSVRTLTAVLAALVGLSVVIVTIQSREPVGAGIYYDDGAYLGLARSLAEGRGYVYSNLPDSVPGVKYPPAWPVVLAVAWKVFDVYPENLAVFKTLNAILWGGAAAGIFLLFASGGRRRVAAVALMTAYAFLTVPSMSIATVLLSEPLFLAFGVGALLVAARAARPGRAEARGGDGSERQGRRELGWALGLGLLGALAFLTRTVGLTLIAAILIFMAVRRRWSSTGIVAAAAGLPSVAWLGWAAAHGAGVGEPILGQYGAYGAWLRSDATGGAFEHLGATIAAHWAPLVETLQFIWLPRTSGWALAVAALALGAATVRGLVSVWRRNPALALFPVLYLSLVFVWPYEPYRFYYLIAPVVTLLAFEGLWEIAVKIRDDLPRWGAPVGILVAGVFAVNVLAYHGRGHALRSWATPQRVPARVYAPLNDWIRANTSADEVIASGLDPYVYWETGRTAVPAWRFVPEEYGAAREAEADLAADLDAVIRRFRPRYAALVLGRNKAGRTLEAFARLHPTRALRVFETEGSPRGVIYALGAPGETVRDREPPQANEEPGEDPAP